MGYCLPTWNENYRMGNGKVLFKSLFFVFLLSFVFQFASAQGGIVKGRITTGDSALANITVQVKGTSRTTQTNDNGEFTISASPTATLVVTSVGYARQEVRVNNQSALAINLQGTSQQLEQVVVIGYGSQRRKDVTGSVSSVTAAQIEKVPVTTLDQALQGRSAGVQVTSNDASPGSGIQVQIRGVGSLGNNDPLYVVDGYPITGGLNTINPNDIASIDILKDASATAIYGNRASNGVVIISTKRGKRGGVQLSVDALTSVQSMPKMYKVLNAQQWATLATELAPQDGFSTLPEWSTPASLTNVDWQKAIYQTGLKQNYNLALRGGSDKVQTSFSAGYFDQKGVVKGSDFNRVNLSANVDYSAFTWLKSTTSLKYTRNDNKIAFGTGGQGAAAGVGYLSRLPPTITGNKLTNQIKDGNGNYGFYNPGNVNVKSWGNPLYSIETQDQKNLTNYFLGSTSLEAAIFDGLKIKTNLGINTNDYSGYYFTPSDTRAIDQYGQGNQSSLNYYSQSANNTFEWLWENTLSYTKTFGGHSIDFVGGVSSQKNTYRQIGANGNNLPSDQLRNLSSVPTLNSYYGNEQTYSLASQFGRLSYKFMDRYLITGTVRRDGSSKFASGHQYGIFPSGSIAWRVKQEPFLQHVYGISDLKIRAGYGEVGSQASIGLFRYLGQYTPGGGPLTSTNVGYPFGNVYQAGLILNSLPDADLKWETSKQTDIGMDLAFLNNSLTITVDYYKKESKDFLLNIPVPAQTGFTLATRNVGSISNSGVEVAVDYRKSVSDFTYGINLNFSTLNNKLLSLATNQKSVSNLDLNNNGLGFPNTGANTWVTFSNSKIGGPVGEFYGYKSAGIFQTQAEVDALNAAAAAKHGAGALYQSPGPTKAGDRKFVDVNGDGQVTADDQVSLGSPIPKFFAGLNLDGSYKAFDLNVFFYAVSGNKIFNYQQRTLETFGNSTGAVGVENVGEDYFKNRWMATNPSNRYARATANDFNGNGRPSDVYIEDGSYLRLRSVQLGYTVPASIAGKITASRIRLYVSAQNLFTITKYKGLDPEIGQPAGNDGTRSVAASGIDAGTYPNSKFFTFGLNVTF